MNCPKLPVSVERDLRLQNPIKIYKVDQVAIWGNMELVCKRNREKKLVRQELKIKEAKIRRDSTLSYSMSSGSHLVRAMQTIVPFT